MAMPLTNGSEMTLNVPSSVLTLKSISGSLQQEMQFAINTIRIIKLHTDRTTNDEGTSAAGASPGKKEKY
jgi:hypothetical protein